MPSSWSIHHTLVHVLSLAAITPTPRSSDWLLGYAVIHTHTATRPSAMPSSWSIHHTLVSRAVSEQQSRLRLVAQTGSWDTPLAPGIRRHTHTHGNQAIGDAFILVDPSHSSFTCCLWAAITPTPRSSDWLLGYAVIHTHTASRPSVMPSSWSIYHTLFHVLSLGSNHAYAS
ncbi:hypothetical protein J6590_022899 [Homalodisca vitripennis]|nr:hypothetical protein J6590_022899 [Homalodisca vitripennis]